MRRAGEEVGDEPGAGRQGERSSQVELVRDRDRLAQPRHVRAGAIGGAQQPQPGDELGHRRDREPRAREVGDVEVQREHSAQTKSIAAGRGLRDAAGMPDPYPTRTLGSSGPTVGAIGLGCMGMSWAYDPAERDDETSIARHPPRPRRWPSADRHRRHVRPVHQRGARRPRARAAGATRRCSPPRSGWSSRDARRPSRQRDGRPEHLRAAIDASLQRLGVDHVDLYYLHRVDPTCPSRSPGACWPRRSPPGKARAIGLSEVSRRRARPRARHPPRGRACSPSCRCGRATASSRCCSTGARAHGAAFVPSRPLGRGFLTGTVGGSFDADDLRSRGPRSRRRRRPNLPIVDRVRDVAARTEPRRRRSRSPGRSPRARTSSRSPAPSPATSRRTPARPTSR